MNLPAATPPVLDGFHPAVSAWFTRTFPSVTAAQARAWPLIRQRRSTLIAAPTGSGKTLTAFLAVLDDLVRQGLALGGELPDATLVVYVSPLKALSNDIQINLQNPLAGITEQLRAEGLGSQLDVLRSDARLAGTEASLPQLQAQRHESRVPSLIVLVPLVQTGCRWLTGSKDQNCRREKHLPDPPLQHQLCRILRPYIANAHH